MEQGAKLERPAGGGQAAILTPLGPVPALGLADLIAFGAEADRLEYPRIGVGGFVVPGRGPAVITPGREDAKHAAVERGEGRGSSARAEAGSAAGSWERSSPPQAAAPGAPPYALERQLAHLNLDLPELADYHPLARVTVSTDEIVMLNIPIGLVATVPLRARLVLEVPLVGRGCLSRAHAEKRLTSGGREFGLEPRLPTAVPDVRAWALWDGGDLHGARIVSHHQNPDGCICACLRHEWVRGVHPLNDYVGFCIVWVAKVLHERVVGWYPGPQHYGPFERLRRDRPNEYCGCGKRRRYGECCREADRQLGVWRAWKDLSAARGEYVEELRWQGRGARSLGAA